MRIDGHIINTELLTEGGWILDAGCRHFKLPKKLGNQFNYICLDPDPIIEMKNSANIKFHTIALKEKTGTFNYCGWSTGEGNYCYEDKAPHYATIDRKIHGTTIKALMDYYLIKQFELIKLDIEGSEYDVLLSIQTPAAKQIAVEFHQSLGYNKYGTHEEYLQKLMNSEFGKLYKETEHYESHPGIYEYNFQLK